MSEILSSSDHYPQNSFEARYNRLLEATGCKTQVELGEFLKIRQSSVSDAKSRNAIPSDWLITLLKKKNINPLWVLNGLEPKFIAPLMCEQLNPHLVRIVEVKPPEQCTAQELINELVRRALQTRDNEAILKEVAGSWLPAYKR